MNKQKTSKMKRLMPTLREKKRYIVFETVNEKDRVITAVNNALKDFLGILGLSKVNPSVINFENGKGIIRINHAFKDEVITALSLIKDFKIKVITVSGILKKAMR